jgi:hypothetical protein
MSGSTVNAEELRKREKENAAVKQPTSKLHWKNGKAVNNCVKPKGKKK